MSGDGEHVLFAVDGPVAIVTINRPQARNSLLRGMGSTICRMLRDIAGRREVRALVFRGAGADFCPGADLKSSDPPGRPAPKPDRDAYEVSLLLHEMPQVTIAAIRGACAGAGFGWACACDFRVSDESAKFNTAFLDAGVAGDMAVPWTLPRIIGSARARNLMFFPCKIGAEEAFALGLVQWLWPAEVFETELGKLTAALSLAAPLALAAMKANFIDAEQLDLRGYIAREADRHIALLQTEDRVEAFRSLVEKRAPVFKAR